MGPADLNERRNGNGRRPTTTAMAASIIVLFLSGAGAYIWDLQEKVEALKAAMAVDFVSMARHRSDLDRLNDFMTKGDRFTFDMGERLEKDFDALSGEHKTLRVMVGEIRLKQATLPQTLLFPFSGDWQDRILRNERAIAKCTLKLEVTNERYSVIERQFMVLKRAHPKEELKSLGVDPIGVEGIE